MIRLERILHPTDLSENSACALRYAVEFAARLGAELHLLYVLEESMAKMPVQDAEVFPPPDGYLTKTTPEIAAKLSAVLGVMLPSDQDIVRVTRMGFPFQEIVRYAEESETDMIVMGTHGRSGLSHVLMGSVAERVVRQAPCPVFVARPEGHQFTTPDS